MSPFSPPAFSPPPFWPLAPGSESHLLGCPIQSAIIGQHKQFEYPPAPPSLREVVPGQAALGRGENLPRQLRRALGHFSILPQGLTTWRPAVMIGHIVWPQIQGQVLAHLRLIRGSFLGAKLWGGGNYAQKVQPKSSLICTLIDKPTWLVRFYVIQIQILSCNWMHL